MIGSDEQDPSALDLENLRFQINSSYAPIQLRL